MDLREPEISDDEVLIQVTAASINPIDLKIRNGEFKAIMKFSFPLVLGHDCAGVIVKKGSRVKRFEIGDEVFAQPQNLGTFADFVAAKEEHIAQKPTNISFDEAASLPLVALTSWQTLFERGQMKPGDKVFIAAGSGGVGSIAIQLAKHFGAHVITTAGTKNIDLVHSLGADQIFDYKKEDFSQAVSNVDIAFDTVGGETQKKVFGILKPGGTLVSIVGPPTAASMRETGRGIVLQFGAFLLSLPALTRSALTKTHYKFFIMHPDGAELAKIAELVENASIRPVIDRVFPFDEADEALRYAETGHARGKVVVSLSTSNH